MRPGLFLLLAGLASCQPVNRSPPSLGLGGDRSGGGDGASPGTPTDHALSVRINEVMVSNTSTVADEDGAHSSWLELYNPTDSTADLSGVFLSDELEVPDKWALPSGPASVMVPRGYLVIFCDGKASGPSTLHAPFTLKAGPLEVVLNKGLDLFFADGSALGRDQSMGRSPDGADQVSVLSAPTPGAANAGPLDDRQGVRGDVDRNGRLEITDAIDIIGFLYLGTFTPYCMTVADSNADRVVDVSDLVAILSFLFYGGPPLPDLTEGEIAACAGGRNDPPSVPPRPVYHAHPGFPVEFRIEATDPEEDRLLYEAVDLPPGASIEADTGLLRWTPAPDQIGPFYLSFSVSDEALPPHRVGGRLVFQVHPLDPCTRPDCDPALGCQPVLLSISEECCGGPGPRVSDPQVGCPEGRVLHVGRNPAGSATIGILENCDQLRLVPLGQGGHVARLNLEARCLVPQQVLVEARLETARGVMFNESVRLDFQALADGFIQDLGLRFIAEGPFDEGTEAQLSVALTDTDGVRLERKVRLALTRNPVADLP